MNKNLKIVATTHVNTNSKACEPDMERVLKIPGVMRASDFQSQARTSLGQPCLRRLESAAVRQKACSLNPESHSYAQQCLAKAIQETGTADMRRFVKDVMSEPEVARVLTTKVYPGQPFPIEMMRRASRIAKNRCGWMQPQRDVLHAAVMLAGVREVLTEQGIFREADAGSVLFGIVCMALHRLDNVQASMGNMLRLSQNWGRAEEEDTEFADGLKALVAYALAAVGLSSRQQESD